MPPEVVVREGDYLDGRSAWAYERQKAAAEERMARFDAADAVLRRVWDAVSDERMARGLVDRGVRDFETAERVRRVMKRA